MTFFSLFQDTGGIKFPDFKASGVYLRSQRMKLPPSVGQKKTKAIEQLLEVAGVDANPVPSEIMYVFTNPEFSICYCFFGKT